MSYEIGELIVFHDEEGNVDDTAIILESRVLERPSYYLKNDNNHSPKELIYKIHLTEDGRVVEYPEYHLKLRASSRKEYEAKYGV